MSTPAEIVRDLIAKRHSIDSEAMSAAALTIFTEALKDRLAAEELVKTSNRIVRNLYKYGIEDVKFLEFASKYPDLTERLITDTHMAFEHHLLVKQMRGVMLAAGIHPVSQEQDYGRTHLLIAHPAIKRVNGQLVHQYNGKDYPVVTRHVRDFSHQIVFSMGASDSREYLKLDPTSVALDEHYQNLNSMLRQGMSTLAILKKIKKVTRDIFPSTEADEYVDKRKLPIHGSMVIGLDEFTEHGVGLCRHHTFLNAYFLSRLVDEKWLEGEVIHHRQNIKDGAHAWNLFIDNRGESKKLYSLDTLWDEIVSVTDNPGQLNELYEVDAEGLIEERFDLLDRAVSKPEAKQQQDKGAVDSQPPLVNRVDSPSDRLKEIIPSTHDMILRIKTAIESRTFPVGQYFFFQGGVDLLLDTAVKKRVPHRVADIYHLIMQYNEGKITADDCLEKIKAAAENAIHRPRPGRTQTTTEFYQSILAGTLVAPGSERGTSPGFVA